MTDYPWLLLAVYVAVVGTVQLLALWAASSRRPWLLRALAVWMPIALLAAIRAHEPALLLLVSAALTIGLSFAVQRWGQARDLSEPASPPFWRFRLADLLVLMLLLATWLGVTRNVPLTGQFLLLLRLLVAAAPLAMLTLFVHRAVTGPNRVRATLLALSVIWLGAVVLRCFRVGLHLGDGPSSLHYGLTSGSEYLVGLQAAALTSLAMCLAIPVIVWPRLRDDRATNRPRVIRFLIIGGFSVIAILLAWLNWEIVRVETFARLGVLSAEVAMHSIFFLSLAAFIALGTWLARASFGTSSAWQRLAARAAAISLLLVAVPPLAWLYWQMLAYAPFPPAKRSSHNNYDRIAEITRHLYQYKSNLPLPPQARIELDEVVVLLRGANYVPLHVRLNPGPDGSVLRREGTRLWMRLQEAADDAGKKRQFDRAADYAVAMIRFEAMLNQGARPNSGYWGYQVLLEHRDHFSGSKAREVIDLLDKTLAELETPEYLAARDRALDEYFGGWRTKLRLNLARLKVQDEFDYGARVEQIETERRRLEALNRLLNTDLAIRMHQRQHGHLPDSLQDLIRGILLELPLDPYSGKPLIYRTTESGFLLYSVGPDGVDDGGLHWELIPVGVGRDMALPGP